MDKKITIHEIWSINKIKAISYYEGNENTITDPKDYVYVRLLLDALHQNSLVESEREIVTNPDFMRKLRHSKLPHYERLTNALYLSGNILSEMNLREIEDSFEDLDENVKVEKGWNSVVYTNKFKNFKFIASNIEEIEKYRKSKFFKNSKLTMRGDVNFLKQVKIEKGTKILVIEKSELDDLSNFSFMFDRNGEDYDTTELESIYLNNNNISNIDNSFKDGLRLIDLSNNNFEYFDSLCLPITLKTLNLSNNLRLESVNFKGFKYIELLDLSNTAIEVLDRLPLTVKKLVLIECENLKEIILEDNFVLEIKLSFDVTVYLHNSYVEKVSAKNAKIKFVEDSYVYEI